MVWWSEKVGIICIKMRSVQNISFAFFRIFLHGCQAGLVPPTPQAAVCLPLDGLEKYLNMSKSIRHSAQVFVFERPIESNLWVASLGDLYGRGSQIVRR